MALGDPVAVVYQRLGRAPPSSAPPGATLLRGEYQKRLLTFWRVWRSAVEAIGRETLGSRADARRTRSLDQAFEALLDAAGVETAAITTARKASRAQGAYVERVTKRPVDYRAAALKQAEEEFRAVNMSLVRSLGREHIPKLTAIMADANSKGLRWEEAAKRIGHELGVGESRAKLIARDQTNKIVSDMARVHQQAAGVTEYTWRTSKDLAVRGNPAGVYPNSDSDHFHLEGKRFSWSQAPVTNEKTGERNHPGQDILCRCTAEAVIPLFAAGGASSGQASQSRRATRSVSSRSRGKK